MSDHQQIFILAFNAFYWPMLAFAGALFALFLFAIWLGFRHGIWLFMPLQQPDLSPPPSFEEWLKKQKEKT